ncbi:MAG: sporulation protein [Rhodoferax ferrireducens]|uniref:Sporulation protein n=2 Tax=Pseudomonadota TaxID=1224 RepID=A0A1Y1QZ65_9GAMM|nr:MAG: sporulation protein [Rhodoferax ferrireducens]OQX16803.1 MAG: sporulation protein [Thiothrix lacustris]
MKQQRGGTFLGFVLGMVVGLGVALAVAVYVTKVPVPFLDKGANRPADQDAVEQQKNKDWDPNAPLYGKNPARPAASAEQVETLPAKPAASSAEAGGPELKPAVTADPLGDLVKAKLAGAKAAASDAANPAETFIYFVQVGAYRSAEDAESQRAKLSLAGIETKMTEREQAGRTVYRVRMGPFDAREEAEKAKARLEAVGQEAAMVRVAR